MKKIRNILFLMCDQLRWDYLSCYGHPHLHTPNIDKLAEQGVRFSHAYCQATLCGPSRASYYTGRYMSSHGAIANEDALRAGELTLADYMRDVNLKTVLIGKTDTSISEPGLERLGVDPDSAFSTAAKSGGFEVYERYEGIYPGPTLADRNGYADYLKEKGYDAENPWETFANTAIDASGKLVSGWHMRNAHLPIRVEEQHSETAFLTQRAIEFINESHNAEQGWCLHLSYFKPHWPYLAPAPYHSMYSSEHVITSKKSQHELDNPHPVYQAFMQQEYSINFAKDNVRNHVIPAYMGLVKQIDNHIGILMQQMKKLGLLDNTLIVFSSDHGDYLGDHWLGEKDLFHEPSVKVPLIIYDPTEKADPTRGSVCDALVGGVDVIPTFVEALGGEICVERLEGKSLIGFLHGKQPEKWRETIISEVDYSDRGVRALLNQDPYLCRIYMLRSKQWKYIYYEGFQPQLFDLVNDPDEYRDLGNNPDYKHITDQFKDQLFDWFRHRKIRTEMPAGQLDDMGPERDEQMGVIIGRW